MFIGVDVGGTNLVAGVMDGNFNLLAKVRRPTVVDGRGARGVVDDVSALCETACAAAGIAPGDIERIGIGTPGSVDFKSGTVLYANNIPYDNTPVAAFMREKWNCPIHIENDANCAALGEAVCGAARDAESMLLVTLGTGIGGGIVFGQKVYSGFNGTAGEIGHTVIAADGWQCSCGRKGCWEAYSSATGLVRMTREAMPELERPSGRTAFVAAREGDVRGQAVVDKYIKFLAIGIANMINILQPEIVCIGGGICNEGDALLLPLTESVRRESYRGSQKVTQIRVAQLGNDAGVIGAGLLGRD